ncbi:MAG: hypothetical protein Q7V88_00610 [Actinomycetota bacterium]|nr:hypothetical protein [Actinomycetota bacterium]
MTAAESPWVMVPAGLPLFQLDGIAPGDRGAATMTVTNPGDSVATFTLAIIGLESDDNGCNEPEQAAGDATCARGGGELQFDLRLTLTAAGGVGRPIAAGTVAEWAAHPVADPVLLTSHETRSYRVGYELPIETSNMTQSDIVAFAFQLRLVLVASEAPPVVVPATPSLPRTGVDARPIVIIGLATVLAGLGMHRLSTRRRRST